MKREKPQQQLYRPGSGPLRKSNISGGIEESESDTNLIINSGRHNHGGKSSVSAHDNCERFRSEGSSPRNYVDDTLESTASKLADLSLHQQRRPRKPEQPLYVCRPMAHSKEIVSSNTSQEYDDFYTHQTNGNDGGDRFGKRYNNRRRGGNDNEQHQQQDEWRMKNSSKHIRQGSEPRGLTNGAGWQRTRDTRSVEPTGLSNRNYNTEKQIQAKPPSGRRHSTIGVESDKRHKQPNYDVPPRFRKNKEETKLNQPPPPVEETWDGNSITFSNPSNNYHKNSSFHQMPSNFQSLPVNQMHTQNHMGYNTLPNRPRGRGRLSQHDFDHQLGMYRPMTPERLRSPCNSRPSTPPNFNRGDSRPHTPHRDDYDYGGDDRYNYGQKKNVYERLGPRRHDRDDQQRRFKNDNNTRRHYNSRRDADGGGGGGRRMENDRRDFHKREHYNRGGGGGYSNNRRDRNANNRHSSDDYSENWDNVKDEKAAGSFRESLETQLSPVSPESFVDGDVKIKTNTTPVLDWGEEVEMQKQLEAEAMSDTMTRSSSVSSLVDISTRSMPAPSTIPKKTKRRNRKKSRQRGDSASRDQQHRGEFKPPAQQEPRGRRRRNSRETSYDRFHNRSRNSSRDCSFERNRNSSTSEQENWRAEIRTRQNSEQESRSRHNSEVEELKPDSGKKAGIIVLPTNKSESINVPPSLANVQSRYVEPRKSPAQQKSLFDPNNPNKPIIVKSQSSRVTINTMDNGESSTSTHNNEQANNGCLWYNENSDHFKSCNYPDLLRDIKKADSELQYIVNNGFLLSNSQLVEQLRDFLKQALEYLLCKATRFCESENVEQHFWRILFYNMIEVTRNAIVNDPENKECYKRFLLYLIDDGTQYFERLLTMLEETHQFKLNNYLGSNSNVNTVKGLGMVGLALVSAQKLFLFLGDLGRYREQVNETSNYGKCRQWYIKAHEINPKNGKPYNQLAILAVYARRKLDAVYYYMRSLMSSNPVPSAKEALGSMFYENRKKYEQGEKKRREERLERARQQMKQKESENVGNSAGCLRKETWIHPEGGPRVHRTTQTIQDQKDSEEEDLASLSSVEVNKRFVISYLHVHGKLITNIGMDTFQEAAMQMLKEFRALLQHSPVPLPCNRFLQLLALNMFAIESTQLKDPQLQSQPGYRSELQERALVVSLQMFNLILERCVSILQEHVAENGDDILSLPQDAIVLLPAIKIWCDWLMFHSNIWNPPPSTQDFKVGTSGDAWTRLAVLMNILDQMEKSAPDTLITQPEEGYEIVRLPEDSVLCGFTPLMFNAKQEQMYAPKDLDIELAQFTLRLRRLLFFGTKFLCGLELPVLKLELNENDRGVYVSVVCTSNSRDSPPSPQELACNQDVLHESFSDGEDEGGQLENYNAAGASSEVRDLLHRKEELERRQRDQELRNQQVKKILSQSVVSVHIEVRPKYLVPDTNCFIDHVDRISVLASSHCYSIMVPIVVLSELEGLARGGKSPMPGQRTDLDLEHAKKVGESAKQALTFLKSRHQSVKCVTTKGTKLTSTTFTTEDDSNLDNNLKNDDKILVTCLALCKTSKEPQPSIEGIPRQLVREVVLLTEDRNLRVKAYARDVPVRELPDFMRWAGLG